MARQAELAEAMRMFVFEQDDQTCRWCRKRFWFGDLAVDHIIPLSRCDLTVRMNLQTLCRWCNSIKGSLLPDDYPEWVPDEERESARGLSLAILGFTGRDDEANFEERISWAVR